MVHAKGLLVENPWFPLASQFVKEITAINVDSSGVSSPGISYSVNCVYIQTHRVFGMKVLESGSYRAGCLSIPAEKSVIQLASRSLDNFLTSGSGQH